MYYCEECNLEFETFQAKANHHRWKHLDNSNYLKNAHIAFFKNDERLYGKWIKETVKCSNEKCNNNIHIKYREGKKKIKYFCSRSCANYRGSTKKYFTKEIRNNLSNIVKNAWVRGDYDHTLDDKRFSSKREREIRTYFKEKYPEYEWKSNRLKNYKNEILTCDLYSHKLKICFEYDGVWHFKNICNQLKDKQHKDKLLENWCLENNYRLIRIDENENLSFQEIEKLFFENNTPIIKIGKRY